MSRDQLMSVNSDRQLGCPRPSMRYSVGSGRGPRCNSRYIRTCCGMAAATPWRTPATTPGRCRLGSGTETFSTRCVTPTWRRTGSRIYGAIRQPFPLIVYDASFPGGLALGIAHPVLVLKSQLRAAPRNGPRTPLRSCRSRGPSLAAHRRDQRVHRALLLTA